MKRKLTNSDLRQNKTWALPSENLGFMWKDRDNYRRKDKLSLMHNAYTLCCTYFSYTCTVNNSTVKCMMHMLQWTAEWFRTMLITQFPSELRSFWLVLNNSLSERWWNGKHTDFRARCGTESGLATSQLPDFVRLEIFIWQYLLDSKCLKQFRSLFSDLTSLEVW